MQGKAFDLNYSTILEILYNAMSFFDQQNSFLTAISNNKKTIIIAGVTLFGVALVAALLAGIFIPSTQPAPTTQVSRKENAPTGTTPLPSIAQTSQSPAIQTISPVLSPQAQYTYVPEPTFDFNSLRPTKIPTPTPTPLPGTFYIANGKQNALIIKLYKRKDWDLYYEVQLINTRTRETRLLGYTYEAAPGDSAFFSRDFSRVIFVGGSKTDYQKIIVYSIPLQKPVKIITLDQMKAALPSLQIQKTATLSQMLPSPDGKKVALSYGNTYNVEHIDPNTSMFVIDLTTNRMQMLPAKGLVHNWKDNTTIEYELPPGNPAGNPVQEVKTTLP